VAPTQTTIVRQSIVDVPLFTAPYTVPSNISTQFWSQGSPYPFLTGNLDAEISSGVFNILTSELAIPGLGDAISETQLIGSGGSGLGATYVDGFVIGYGAVNPALPFSSGWFSTPMPTNGGNWDAQVSATEMIPDPFGGFTQATGAEFLQIFEGSGQTNGVGQFVISPNLAAGLFTARFLDPGAGNLPTEVPAFTLGYGFVDFADTTSGVFNIPPVTDQIGAGPGAGDSFCLIDSQQPNTGSNIPRQICRWTQDGAGILVANYHPVFDDPVLEACWTGASLYSIQIFAGGFLVMLNAGGLGPTKQPYELAVVSKDMTTYNLMNLVPQDPTAQDQILEGATGTGWNVRIDPNGVVYFNNGDPTKRSILYSYSPIGFGYPQFQADFKSFNLPCYTPCWPQTP